MAFISESDKFVRALIDNDTLFDKAKEWMRENLKPDEVFSEEKLIRTLIDNDTLFEEAKEWMRKNLEPDEVFSEEELIRCVKANYNLTDVFDFDKLENWAFENGFTKPKTRKEK